MTQNAWKRGNLKANAHLQSPPQPRRHAHVFCLAVIAISRLLTPRSQVGLLQGAVSRSPTLLVQWNRRLPHYARSTLARSAKTCGACL